MALRKSRTRRFVSGAFLLDVLGIALTAFGGPQVHITQFHKKFVLKRKYLTEPELKEITSLCQMMPGPTSTQMITAISYKNGGPLGAFLGLAVWVLPASILMTILAVLIYRFDLYNPKLDFLKYIQPMAVGFIIYAAYKFKGLFVTRSYHWILMIVSAFAGIWFTTPVIFPVLLLLGGIVSNFFNHADITDVKRIRHVPWGNFFLFVGVFFLAAILGAITHNKGILLFENTYRYGSIVFGGGHVLIPMMYNQFVEFKQYLSPNEFLLGVGVLQAIPGPVFSISTFTGAMILKDWNGFGQILGAIIGTVGIFLPGTFLIFFVYPIWAQVKRFSPVKNAIEGINATSAGLVISSAYLLFRPVEVNEMNMSVLLGTLFVLLTTKIPNPVVVIICMALGILY
ncbi:MAG: chromate efflux transporter [Bacteroidia bacterium]|jgi:chromate transporter